MRSWSGVPVPSLQRLDVAPAVRIHDTASGSLVESSPDGAARMYVCGITPYDATHLGHANTYLAFDLLNRAWRDAGHAVSYVQNVTDVDDPLLERAAATGVGWRDLAEHEIELFREDCAALRILPPDDYVGVVESMSLVTELVQRLADLGHAYEVDSDWYFSTLADSRFGSVSHLSHDEMIRQSTERGGDPERSGKKDPVDCLLWRAERPGEPAWESPLGRGRPGWHVECSAIALARLGERFDVQGGGSDLVFPHHEFSASQAQAAQDGSTFANAYMHAGMVGFEGEKMSKSRGNLVKVSDLRRAGVDPVVLRLALLSHHYREDWEWTDEALKTAEDRLARWRDAVEHTDAARAEQLVTDVRAALADDLDTPGTVALLDEWASTADGDGSGAQLVRDLVDARLGLPLSAPL